MAFRDGGSILRRHRAVALVVILAVTVSLLPSAVIAAALPVPAAEASSAAVAVPEVGHTDLFTRSAAGGLLHQYRPAGGSWTRTLDLGGGLASSPAAVSWAPGRIDVFARGVDGTLVHRWSTKGQWSSWESLGGGLTSAPAATSWAEGRLDVVARGTDHAIYHRSYASGSGWSAWRSLGGTLTSSPAVATRGDGHLDVVARGTDARVWLRSQRDGAWSGWRSMGGTATSQPAITAADADHLDLFVRGTDDAMWTRTFRDGRWTSWHSRGGVFASGPSAAASEGAVRVVGRSPNERLYEAARTTATGTWTGWTRVDPLAPFRRLGTWVKIWDYPALDPAVEVARMRARGVRVLYLQTGRFTSATDLHDPAVAGRWLDAAHAAGIDVVGWYVPGYGDLTRDVRRTVAVATFVSPGGQRFDGVGVDIEYYGTSGEVPRETFYHRIAPHLDDVRRRMPAVVGAIVPPPFATEPGTYWEGFPWTVIGPRSEVVIPMAMWSNRTTYSADQVRRWVRTEVERTRALTGRPVMVEGGIGTPDVPDVLPRVEAFVRGAVEGRAIGGAHWDYPTTDVRFWSPLRDLNAL